MRPSVVKVVSQHANDLQRALYFSRAPIPCDRDILLANETETAAQEMLIVI
nr:hypothetical protein [Psychrobacter immobilis]